MTELDPKHPIISLQAGDRRHWGKLPGSATALALANAAGEHQGLSLVITSDTASAQRLEAELSFFSGGKLDILHLADWETLPYDSISPHQDIISERLRTLFKLPSVQQGILVVPVTSLLQRLMPTDYLLAGSLVLKVGDQLDIDTLRSNLTKAGYRTVDTVYEHGEYAVRGSLIDLYPMGSDWPLRIDLFDDEVDSLRTFDPDTQLTEDKIDDIELLPAREYPLDKQGISAFKQRWHQRFDVDPTACSIYRDVGDGIAPPGIEYYLPLFFDHTSTLFDYLPKSTITYTTGDINAAIKHFWGELSARYESRRVDNTRPLLAPDEIYLRDEELFGALKTMSRTDLHTGAIETGAGRNNYACTPPPSLPVNAQSEHPLTALEAFLMEFPGRVLFCAESAGRRETLLELLNRIRLRPKEVTGWHAFAQGDDKIAITVGNIDQGLCIDDPAIALITESQLFGERVQQTRRRRQSQENADNVVKNLTELQVGAPVVHIDHGVGRYRGLETISVEGEANEFLMLEYAEDAKLYVPVTSLHLISRYSGADENVAPLHRLGSEQWGRAKRKAAEQVRDTAAELLDIYARRAARKGYAFGDPKADYLTFAAGFPFEETPDQQVAIDSVVRDMLAPQPMDRLVCGDVGFGKTEVAMRAAFVAAHAGKQVAILAPTTLLAQQHYESLKDRFASWPFTIEVMSRFRTNKDVEAVKERLANGKVDIVVGTHKLIQPDIKYKDLGLLIIDEEHRFGVRQKEQLKKLRAEIDMLALTATPIPRTLNMSMAGIRDLSIIATPPARRLSVKTFVRQHEEAVIKEAILREILRGGQVYYLHNEVKSIERTARALQELVPEARIGIGHGQMRERELEKVMSDFYHKRFNVMVCSTIIETGIDIPSANTIIIHRADKFGLAQLHQLRGRVGRSHHQAYAYLLTPEQRAMTTDAVKRLEAIAGAEDLGAGFTIATHDMEIRGAGELLGDEQSGQIQTVGFSMYMDMLDRAVKAMRAGKEPNIEQPLADNTDVNLRIPALIPEEYLPDVHSRLVLYKRIAGAESHEALRELQVEMIDRFGLLPEPAKNLLRVTEIKLAAEAMGVAKLEASSAGGKIEFGPDTQVDPLKIVQLVQSQPTVFSLAGANGLNFKVPMVETEDRLQRITDLLDSLKSQ
ncbi:transcription-repair coupling factor [Gilvimarinus sp. SDUM040013]|uniref:Transcription-repair-coupling factor n=1 Tax=Gilvimarinus gilvus TaxID=3058038 RepID=A0ABU4RXQ4_9GAMM|nr:transcription-repair coupling factor [Gilvimarinus sp. SDUM040013]MDO3386386.1 transcription-repair coupling factor [Gilvimarinus sp. SDUM040013]MDX6849652.1 transcription-repair coupling factor [Gilvimarinus sp. SDUM040013]